MPKEIAKKDAERFWSNVDIREADECWEWMSYKTNKGYGQVGINKKIQYAHRVSWILTNGKIPKGLFICHHCDNSSCVNPSHLFIGTAKDNSSDMVSKGRSRSGKVYSGEDNSQSKLTAKEVRQIRSMYETGKYTKKALGEIFSVSDVTIHNIVYRKKWKHLK